MKKTLADYALSALLDDYFTTNPKRKTAAIPHLISMWPGDNRTLRKAIDRSVDAKILTRKTLKGGIEAVEFSQISPESTSTTVQKCTVTPPESPPKSTTTPYKEKEGVAVRSFRTAAKQGSGTTFETLKADMPVRADKVMGYDRAEDKFNKLVAPPPDGEGWSPEVLHQAVLNYAAMPIQSKFRFRMDRFFAQRLFKDFIPPPPAPSEAGGEAGGHYPLDILPDAFRILREGGGVDESLICIAEEYLALSGWTSEDMAVVVLVSPEAAPGERMALMSMEGDLRRALSVAAGGRPFKRVTFRVDETP